MLLKMMGEQPLNHIVHKNVYLLLQISENMYVLKVYRFSQAHI